MKLYLKKRCLSKYYMFRCINYDNLDGRINNSNGRTDIVNVFVTVKNEISHWMDFHNAYNSYNISIKSITNLWTEFQTSSSRLVTPITYYKLFSKSACTLLHLKPGP